MLGRIARLFYRQPPEPQWLDVAILRRRLTDETAPLVVDVRGVAEFDGPLGHIEGALNVPLSELAARQNEITASGRPIVCVCLTDKRSAAAASELVVSGVQNVVVLRGGMKVWREAGL